MGNRFFPPDARATYPTAVRLSVEVRGGKPKVHFRRTNKNRNPLGCRQCLHDATRPPATVDEDPIWFVLVFYGLFECFKFLYPAHCLLVRITYNRTWFLQILSNAGVQWLVYKPYEPWPILRTTYKEFRMNTKKSTRKYIHRKKTKNWRNSFKYLVNTSETILFLEVYIDRYSYRFVEVIPHNRENVNGKITSQLSRFV